MKAEIVRLLLELTIKYLTLEYNSYSKFTFIWVFI